MTATATRGAIDAGKMWPDGHDEERLNTFARLDPRIGKCRRSLRATLAIGFSLPLGAVPCAADLHRLEAVVVWARDDRAYLATRDSSALAPGVRIIFLERDRMVAQGEIAEVFHRELALARLSIGSLAGAPLDRITVMGETPPMRRLSALRVGVPSPRRASTIVRCGPARRSPDGYSVDSSFGGAARLVRARDGGGPWPDTLTIRPFDDATDQEIALERGELDVAVFWPGERSAHLLEAARWRDAPLGARERGVLTGSWRGAERDTFVDAPVLAAMNQELFDGDLEPLKASRTPGADSAAAASPSRRVRVVVDGTIPGQRVLQRFFDRREPGHENALVLHLSYADLPARDAPTADPAPRPAPVPLFRPRCPVVCEPALRAYVMVLTPDAFADLIPCAAGAR